MTGTDDMRIVVGKAASGDRDAASALAVYAHRLRGAIARMAATLGGIDALVFTVGVGENAAGVRRRAAEGLAYLGARSTRSRTAPARPIARSTSPAPPSGPW